MKTVLNSISRTFDFKGRSPRQELIFYILFVGIFFLLQILFNGIVIDKIPIRFLLIPLVALVIRRLHDINLSGLYIVVPAVILSLVNFIINGLNQNSESKSYYDIKKMEYVDSSIMNINSTLVIIITIIVLIFLCFKGSSDGDNKYGKNIRHY